MNLKPFIGVPIVQVFAGMGLGMLFLILTVQVLFPNIQISFLGIIPGSLSMVDFVVHEAGHLMFGFLGQFISVLGGTLAQLFIPITCILLSFRKRQWVNLSIFLFWLGQSLVQISRYAWDARTQELKLFSPGLMFGGPAPLHDWHYLLDKTGLLWADHIIGGIIFTGGLFALLASAGLLFAWGAGWKKSITI
jgi:hypothetical protein